MLTLKDILMLFVGSLLVIAFVMWAVTRPIQITSPCVTPTNYLLEPGTTWKLSSM